ncbi:ABC transporter permease [Conexibacter stalactiti]|uniref:ABC transporter permease n=1 Tax=Conexibacter stalactiti TaxID=1940611 RepID=A0ABU4HRH7_9ACTN|nr:ABC transporter permease [Conexibacter stalactiti]MDW5595845.1 ABC transporter permease [Conexibacter stalactiti]MEC5036487.1 ABC transporter permease [Conexibacter stalactiti]
MSAVSQRSDPQTASGTAPAAPRTSRRAPRGRPFFLRVTFLAPLAVILLLLGVWQFISATGIMDELTLPAPTTVAESLWVDRAMYWDNAKVTLTEIVIGIVIGITLGVLLGIAIALQRVLRVALYPLVVGSQSLPVLALAPILVLWLGFGIAPKIVIVVQIIFFPVTVATIQGLSSVSSEVLVFGRSLGASSWTLFWKVRVPAMLPYFFGGLKIASSYAAVAAVIAEWTGSDRGLGALMLRANSDYNTEVVFGSVVIITVIGLSLFGLASLAERKLTPWAHASRER